MWTCISSFFTIFICEIKSNKISHFKYDYFGGHSLKSLEILTFRFRHKTPPIWPKHLQKSGDRNTCKTAGVWGQIKNASISKTTLPNQTGIFAFCRSYRADHGRVHARPIVRDQFFARYVTSALVTRCELVYLLFSVHAGVTVVRKVKTKLAAGTIYNKDLPTFSQKWIQSNVHD